MIEHSIQKAFNALPVPPELEGNILAACRRAALTPGATPVARYVPAVATAAACAAVLGVTLLSVGQQPGGLPTQPESSIAPSAGLVVSDTPTTLGKSTTTLPAPTTTQPPHSTTVSVSQPTQPGDNAACQLAIIGRFEAMTEAQLTAYFGRRVLPTWLPEGLEQRKAINPTQGIYRRDEERMALYPNQWAYMLQLGTVRDAAVVYDLNTFTFVDWLDGDRSLSVSVSSAPYPRHLLGDMTRFDETRQVAGVTVKLAHYDDSPYTDQWCYSALAEVAGVEYYVSAWNITEEAFWGTLESLLAP